jgi:hypothetical protein
MFIQIFVDVVLCIDCHPVRNMIVSGALGKDLDLRIWIDDEEVEEN